MKNSEKSYDIFFVMRYYNNSVHNYDNEIRFQIFKEIKSRKKLNAVVGFASGDILNGKYSEYRLLMFTLKGYISKLAKSKVAVYVRGLCSFISLKFLEYLGLGLPIVGQPILNIVEEEM